MHYIILKKESLSNLSVLKEYEEILQCMKEYGYIFLLY